jgi:prolyl 4-hydroxylase
MQAKKKHTAEQKYTQALNCFSQNNFTQGLKYLKQAALEDYHPAIKELGLCFLYGIGIKHDINKAIIYFKKSRHEAESQFELMKIYYFGYGVTKNLDIARKLLILSVQSRYPPALNIMAVCYVLSEDIEKANNLLNISLSQNNTFAQHIKHLDLINSTEDNLSFIKSFQWPNINKQNKKNILNTNPSIFTIDSLLSDLECEYIKYIASPFMRESMTVDPTTKQFVRDTIRTSYSATIDWLTEDPAINLIMQKCCLQFNEPVKNSEVLHVLHYSVGEEYKPHYDFLGGMENQENFKPEHQRIKTICLYLNDVESGGSTSFPNLDLKVSPKKGKAVFFENINTDNKQPYIESLHAGEPILQGEKWLATLWIRDTNTNRGPNYE